MTTPDGPPPPPDGYGYGGYQPPPPPPPYGYGQPGYGQPGYGYAPPPGSYGISPQTPYGIDPRTGIPYSDKSKLVVGLLQVLVPLGIGRMIAGYTGLGVAQLLVTLFTCGIGALWPFIDGIVILMDDQAKDAQGRLLRP